MGSRILLALMAAILSLGTPGAEAATVSREVFTFNATLTSGTVFCGEFGSEVSCPEKFGTYSGWQDENLMYGLNIGDTVSGRVVLRNSGGALESATCILGGNDCLFSTDLIDFLPVGADGFVDLSETAVVESIFDFGAGTYRFSTDYIFDEDGVHYYSGVEFSLTDVEHGITPVPLPATAGLLILGVAGLGFVARRRRNAA